MGAAHITDTHPVILLSILSVCEKILGQILTPAQLSHNSNQATMLGYILLCLALGCQTLALPTDPPSTPPSTTPSSPTRKPSLDCEACVAVTGCMFVKYEETSETCQLVIDAVSSDPVTPRLFNTTEDCSGSGEDPVVTTTPADTTTTNSSDTTTTTPADTTTTTVPTTTTTETTTTTTITTTTITTPIPDTTTSTTPTTTTTTPTTTTATSSTDTTTTSTSSPTPSTAVPDPEPDTGKGHFDGWSFFGGILLTLGLAAIGLVGFKYYRLRSGTGGNYNRF